MNLWCDIHNKNHRFTPSAVERIVYGLQAMVAEEATEQPESYYADPREICPEQVLREAGDGEAFRDYVDTRRDDRLQAERRKRPVVRQ